MTYDSIHKCCISFHTNVVSPTANCKLQTAHCPLASGRFLFVWGIKNNPKSIRDKKSDNKKL